METGRCFGITILAMVVSAAAWAQLVPGQEFDPTLCPFQQAIGPSAVADPAGNAAIDANAGATCMITFHEWCFPVYYVDGCNPAAYTKEDIWLTAGWNPSGEVYKNVPIPVGVELMPDPTSDGHICIVDMCHGIEYDIFACELTATNRWKRTSHLGKEMLTAMSADKFYLKGSGASPIALSTKGSGFALVPGLIRPPELAAGVIPHALAMSIALPASGGPMPPATNNDEEAPSQYPQALPDGARLRLRPGVWTDAAIAAQAWTGFEKAIAKALRDYGAFITDSSGGQPTAQFYAENPTWYPSDPYASIPGVDPEPWGGQVIFDETFFSSANFEVVDARPQIPLGDATNLASDYDADGIPNAAEIAFGYLDSYTNDPSNAVLDPDGDGLDNLAEWRVFDTWFYPANPFAADSDGDGLSDSKEVADGTDPTDPFSVASHPLSVSTSAVPNSGTAPLDVNFRANVSGGLPPLTYIWDFADGSPTSTIPEPLHTYTSPGEFTASVAVTDSASQQASASVTVTVSAGTCSLTCSASAQQGGLAGEALPFSASATAVNCSSGVAYSWAFGDGEASSERNPSHAYSVAGTYQWALTTGADDQICSQSGSIVITNVPGGKPGDCDSNGTVTIGEVQKAINMFLGTQAIDCGVDCNGDGAVSIGEVQKVINAFLGVANSC